MLRDVVQSGTATKAKTLGRQDLAGKTGTTNNTIDAWFAGYTPHEVAVSWMGYDQPRSLGRVETGGRAALPIWIQYMKTALMGQPDLPYAEPAGLMSLRIDPIRGTLVDSGDYGIYEYFYNENPPPFLELNLPPLTDVFDSGFNPLQPNTSILPSSPNDTKLDPAAPKSADEAVTESEKAKALGKKSSSSIDNARGILNPSGF
jgi:penicillin-binding protein 1A